MKNKKLLSMVAMGIACALSGCNAKAGEMSGEMKTFYEQLDPEAQKKFNELDDAHKKKAMEVLESHACKGESECKGIREKAVEEQYNLQMQEREKMGK